MPDYYRLYDQLRAIPGRLRGSPGWLRTVPARLGYIPERLHAFPGWLRGVPMRLRAAPAEVRRWRTPGGFPVRQAALGVFTVALAVVAGGRTDPRGSTKSSGGLFGGRRSTTPAEVQGRWVTASSGPTNYWSHDTGVYQGSGRGIGQIYEFDAAGNYKTFIHMEVRTDYTSTRMNNRCQGTVDFEGDRLTFHATDGHFDAVGTSNVNRDMNAADLASWSRTYRWQRENGTDGQPRLVLDNEDAAKPERTVYKVLAD